MSFLEGLLWLTLNIYHEARSEPEIGQLAVAHVTINRANQRHKSISEIVTEPYQFSWTFQKNTRMPTELEALQASVSAALKALTTPDFTTGSTFYHRQDISPKWVPHMKFVAQYGSHKFYRNRLSAAKKQP
ncbi:MAG: cell wall hydrolase [Desulfobulbus propionicus]|nr:MAG: cell wall hydrolase [Desulfobulbus propionicus]